MSEEGDSVPNNNSSNFGFGGTTNNRGYMSYYGPGGRMLLVESALEAVSRGSTTIGIKTPACLDFQLYQANTSTNGALREDL
jgi:proteasome alpha subunit